MNTPLMNNTRTSILALILVLAPFSACQKQYARENIASLYPSEVTAIDSENGKGLPFFVGKDLRPVWKLPEANVSDLHSQDRLEPRSLRSFELRDQNGKPVSTESLKGKIGIVSFFYSECPGVCPMTTSNLKQVQKQFLNNDRVAILSLSVTPDRDTPQKLNHFAKKYEIDSRRWKLLTGKKETIYKVARESFNADTYSDRENQLIKLKPEDFLHSENVYLIDAHHRLRGIYAGRSASSLESLVSDVKTNSRNLLQ